jgi:DNA-binding transcriptional MocR family regulator
MISLNLDRNKSIQNQILSYFREKIFSGHFAPGEKLPTVRQLSYALSVSPLTINRAYKKLQNEGLIVINQGSGTYVRILSKSPNTATKCIKTNYDWMLSVDDNLRRTQFANEFSVENTSRGYNMFTSLLKGNDYPYEDIKKLLIKIVECDPDVLFKYSPVSGDMSTRKAVASYLRRYGNLDAKSTDIIMTSGSQQALNMIARTFVSSSDTVLMETPTFPGAIDAFQNQGCNILSVPLENDGINLDILEKLVAKHKPKLIYLTPDINNPTGIVTSNDKREIIIDIARTNQMIIIEDDPWGEYTFDPVNYTLIKHLDYSGHVIYIKGFSKLVGPGFRMGAIYANGTILNRLITAKANSDLGSPLLTQRLLSEILSSGLLEAHLPKIRTIIKNKLLIATRSLSKNAPDYLSWSVPDGGINLWLSLPSHLNTDTFLKEYCHPNDLTFLSGRLCYPNEPEYSMCRLSYSSLTMDEIDRSIKLFCNLLGQYYNDFENHDRCQ